MNITTNVKLYSINCSDFRNQTELVGFPTGVDLKASGTFLARGTAPARYASRDTLHDSMISIVSGWSRFSSGS